MSTAIKSKRRLSMLRKFITQLLGRQPTQAAPEIDGNQITRLRGRLEFVRDTNGVAHLYAEAESDLFIALGYLQARERFVVLDTLRHLGAGRLAEFFVNAKMPKAKGHLSGISVLDVDSFIRPLGFELEAQRDFRKLSLNAQKDLESFALGVNDGLRAFQGVYPAEYLFVGKIREWTPEDCLLAARASAFVVSLLPLENELAFDNMRAQEGDAITQIIYPEAPWGQAPDYSEGGQPELPDGPIDPPNMGSNNWVVSGQRSESGAPILCNDPHVPLLPAPTYWHHVHLECPAFKVQGGMFPGYPGMGFGHNGSIAWGVTTVFRDAWDLFRIRRQPNNPNRYLTAKGVGTLHQHSAALKSRFGRSKILKWESCDHGILYPDWEHHDGTTLALKFVGADLASHFEGHLNLYAAKTVADTQAALAQLNEGPFDFNLVYGHRDGHIAWEQIGLLPKRAKDGLFIRDAQDSNAGWEGYLPFSENPKILNPKTGIVVTANSDTCEQQYSKIATKVHCEPKYRQDRITELLQEKEKHTWQTMAAIQQDIMGVYVLPLRDAICEILGRYPNNAGALGDASVALQQWSGNFGLEEVGATVFRFTRQALVQTVFGKVLGKASANRYTHGQRAVPRINKMLSDAKDPLRELLQQKSGSHFNHWVQVSFEAAVRKLERNFGPHVEDWAWGKVQFVRLGSAVGEVPKFGQRFVALEGAMVGENNTVSPCVTIPEGNRLRAFVGASSRFICDLGKPDEAWFSHCTGPSGDPDSPFFRPLAEQWLRFEYFKSALWAASDVPGVVERVVMGPGLD